MATWFAAKKDLKPDGDEKKGRSSFFARNQQKIAPYVFISPFFLIFTVFFLIPSITALVLSVFKWNGIGTPEFFQLKNYIRMFGDDVFWQAVFNTSIYAAVSLFVVVPLAMVLAVLLNSKHLRYKTLWRAMYYTPVVTSSVAIAIVFQLIYAKESGFLNAGLGLFGIEPISWLGDRVWAKVAISLLIVWTNTGLVSIYFLAGLQGISQSLYEAASIDGASPLQQFFHITVPMLRPIMLFVSILAILGAVQIALFNIYLTAVSHGCGLVLHHR